MQSFRCHIFNLVVTWKPLYHQFSSSSAADSLAAKHRAAASWQHGRIHARIQVHNASRSVVHSRACIELFASHSARSASPLQPSPTVSKVMLISLFQPQIPHWQMRTKTHSLPYSFFCSGASGLVVRLRSLAVTVWAWVLGSPLAWTQNLAGWIHSLISSLFFLLQFEVRLSVTCDCQRLSVPQCDD